MKDKYKVIAYFKVYGLDILGTKHHGFDTGKNNLVEYFCKKKGWSNNKLKTVVRDLRNADVLRKEPSDKDCTCLSLSNLYKLDLKLAEL